FLSSTWRRGCAAAARSCRSEQRWANAEPQIQSTRKPRFLHRSGVFLFMGSFDNVRKGSRRPRYNPSITALALQPLPYKESAMKAFQNKVALVTGGTTGIGRETAVAFGREGARR